MIGSLALMHVDANFLVWSVAGGFSTLAVATGTRAVWHQWRTTSTSSRRAKAWMEISDSVSRFAEGKLGEAKFLIPALDKQATARIVVETLANMARVDERVPKNLRGQKELVKGIRGWLNKEFAHEESGRRAAAAEVVGALRIRQCRGEVALAASDADANVRVAACRALAVVDPEQALGVLLGLVEKDGPWAADLLADLVSRESGVLPGVEAIMMRANEWAATPALLRLLSSSRTPGSERVMLDALEAGDADVRTNASEALRSLASPEAVSALMSSLTDDEENVRLNAVRAIGDLEDTKYALELAAMLGDDSRLVRFAAGEALCRIEGGEDLLTRAAQGTDERAAEAAHLALWQSEQREKSAAQDQLDQPSVAQSSGLPQRVAKNFDAIADEEFDSDAYDTDAYDTDAYDTDDTDEYESDEDPEEENEYLAGI